MKKFAKKALSTALALVMCAGMVAPAFAASFADLQDAINGNNDTADNFISEGRYGYGGKNNDVWDIEAWNDGDTRNVQLNEDVRYGGTDPAPSPSEDLGTISISNAKVNLDLNGNTIDGGYRAEKTNDEGITTQEAQAGSGNSVITMKNADVTISNGDITGGKNKTGGGILSNNSNLTLKNIDVHDNYANHSGGGIRFNVDSRTEVKKNYFIMNGGSLHHNTVIDGNGGGAGNGGGIYIQGYSKGRAVATMTDVDVHHNDGGGYAGGIRTWGTDITLNNVDVRDNFITGEGAGGILVSSASKLIMNGGSITDNKCYKGKTEECVGGGMWLTGLRDVAELNGVRITGNSTEGEGGGIYLDASYSKLILGEGNEIHSNTSSAGASDIYAEAGTIIEGLDQTPKAPEGKQFDGWYADNGEGDKYEGPAKIADDVDLVGNLSDAPEKPTPVVPGTGDGTATDDTAEAPDETEIADPAVPLAAGPVTRAEFIDYLWRHEGEPASDGVCTFTDVPEDHEYVLALAWAEQNKVAFAYDDGTFEPDELVTVAAVREFLGNFAKVFGTNTVAAADLKSLTGADDEAVLNCDEVLAEFFGA